jgi:hypothetical protein
MKGLVCLLMLYCHAAFPAIGADSAELLRERQLFCSQFVIEDPGPAIIHDSTRYCCRFANWDHDCHVIDWDGKYR